MYGSKVYEIDVIATVTLSAPLQSSRIGARFLPCDFLLRRTVKATGASSSQLVGQVSVFYTF